MQIVFRLAYSLAVAILFILFVILGIRTIYPEPESPFDQYRYSPTAPYQPTDAALRDYEDEHADYARNVLIAATALGALAVTCGLYIYRRAEPVALGLMLGGLGVVIYGWAQAGDEFEEMGTTAPFVAVGLGLAAALAAGYYFLQLRGAPPGEHGAG
jgi:hypothetical protein